MQTIYKIYLIMRLVFKHFRKEVIFAILGFSFLIYCFLFHGCSSETPKIIYKNVYIPQKCNVKLPTRQKCLISQPFKPSDIFKCMQYDKLYNEELLKSLEFCTD